MNQLQSLRLLFLAQAKPLFRANPFLQYVLVAQFAAFLIGLISPLADVLVFVPISLFRLHLWRIVTNLFVENNIIIMFWSIYCFHQFILYIQPNWPLVEILKFAIITQFGSLFVMVVSALFLYMFAGLITPFYLAPISGTSALAMGALVALKQFIPDTVLLTTPAGRLKNGHLPFASVALCSALWLFGVLRGTVPFQQIFSAQISWSYLRFFQCRGGMPEPMVGDRSEHFTWASLFPRRAQPLAAMFGRFTFRTLRRLGVLRRVLRSDRLAHAEEETLQMDTLQSLRVVDASAAVLAPEGWDAERRRQKALRMLNERLAAASGAGGGIDSLPSDTVGDNILQGVLSGGDNNGNDAAMSMRSPMSNMDSTKQPISATTAQQMIPPPAPFASPAASVGIVGGGIQQQQHGTLTTTVEADDEDDEQRRRRMMPQFMTVVTASGDNDDDDQQQPGA